jgi:hypothetical protein
VGKPTKNQMNKKKLSRIVPFIILYCFVVYGCQPDCQRGSKYTASDSATIYFDMGFYNDKALIIECADSTFATLTTNDYWDVAYAHRVNKHHRLRVFYKDLEVINIRPDEYNYYRIDKHGSDFKIIGTDVEPTYE